jgi:hypothetical protein
MHKQRVRLTQVTTPDIAGRCAKPMFKVGRTPATFHINWAKQETNDKNKKELLEVAAKFYGKKSVDQYLAQRMVELDCTDPNSFIVVEFRTKDGSNTVDPKNPESKAIPYPFEVNSKEAINYKYDNNILQWLIVLNYFDMVTKKDIIAGEKYTCYLDNESVTAKQVHIDKIDEWKSLNEYTEIDLLSEGAVLNTGVNYLYETKEKSKSQRRYYIINVYEHKLGFNPAMRVGSIGDLTTRSRTCVPLIYPAHTYFEKAIKTVSEFDLTNCLHTFPQKFQYTDPCTGHYEEIEGVQTLIGCLNGMTATGEKCKACSGTGMKYHQSSQDLIQIRMPKDLKDMVSLELMSAYKAPPIDLIEFQKKLGLYEFPQLAVKAVYNSDLFVADAAVKTATEANIDYDSVYDTLKPFADTYSEMKVHIYTAIAKLRDIGNEIQIIHQFPNDFKMKSFTQLLEDYRVANENKAPSYIKKALTRDLNYRMFIDSPQEIVRIETKDKYFPFPGKSESEINYILANNLTSEYNKIFYAHFDLVFSDIEYETSTKELNFYQMDEKMQRDLIKKKVDEYIAAIDTEETSTTAKAFNATQTEQPKGGQSTEDNQDDPNQQ